MALHGEREFIRGDAAAVVADADQAAAAGLQFDVDAAGAGIQRVFDQFLHHRGRTLHHLAGGDLVGEDLGEQADAGFAHDIDSRTGRR